MPNRDMFEPSRRVLHTLNALGRELLSNSDTEDMARKIVTAGIALLPLSVCCLWRRDAARSPDTLRLVMVRGTDPRRPFPGCLRLAGSVSGRALETCRCQVVMDLAKGPASAEKAMELLPWATVKMVHKYWAYKCEDNLQPTLDAMRKAGFPEGA